MNIKKFIEYSIKLFKTWVFKLTFTAHFWSLSEKFLTLVSMGLGLERVFFSLLRPHTGPPAKKV
jgi:hypothetical protein